jgi:hypothetical protein
LERAHGRFLDQGGIGRRGIAHVKHGQICARNEVLRKSVPFLERFMLF